VEAAALSLTWQQDEIQWHFHNIKIVLLKYCNKITRTETEIFHPTEWKDMHESGEAIYPCNNLYVSLSPF